MRIVSSNNSNIQIPTPNSSNIRISSSNCLVQFALVISPMNGVGGGRTARCGRYSARPIARVRKPKSEREETKEPLARSWVLSLSSAGF